MSDITISSQAYLYGNPIFSLNYTIDGEVIYSDLTGYRPNPIYYLSPGKKYDITLSLSQEKDIKGVNILIPRRIKFSDPTIKELVNIR